MARVLVLVFTLISVALVGNAMWKSGGAPAAAAAAADVQLAQVEKAFGGAAQAVAARQRAAAAELTRDPAMLAALAKVAGKTDGPSLDDAPALKDALEAALANLPET